MVHLMGVTLQKIEVCKLVGGFRGLLTLLVRDDISTTRLTPVEPDCGRTIRDKGERGSNRYLATIQLTEMVNPIQVQPISGQSKTQGTTFKAQVGSLSWVLRSQWVDGGGIALIAANALHL